MTRLVLALLTLLAALAGVAPGESAPPAFAPAAAGAARDLGDGVSGVEPPGVSRATKAAAAPRTLRLPPLDHEALDAADAVLRAERPELKLERTGVLRGVGRVRAPTRFDRAPDVARTDSGDLVWTLDLESAGALGLRLRLRRCELPPGATPVIIEDGWFIGSRCIVVEGMLIERESVIGAGVTLTSSTQVIDVTGSEPVELKGRIPPRSVVIPGTRTKRFPAGEYQVPCALIIGQRKESTDKKTSLNTALREFNVSV